MNLYKYKIIRRFNGVFIGVEFAKTKEELINTIKRDDCVIVYIKRSKVRERKKIKNFSLPFFRNLYLLIKNKLDLVASLDVVHSLFEDGEKKAIVRCILNNIRSGVSFSKSTFLFGNYFDDIVNKSIEIAEFTATLDVALLNIVEYLEKKEKLKSVVKNSMIYPIILFSIMMLIFLFWIIYIVPNFKDLINDMNINLPLSTKIIFSFREFLVSYGIVFFLFLICAFKIISLKLDFKKYLCKIPFLKIYMRDLQVAKFFLSMKIMLKNKINLISSLECIKKKDSFVENVIKDIQNGNSFFVSLSKTKLFEEHELSVIKSGEKSGVLCQSFEVLSDILQEKIERKTQNMISILQPALIVFVGLVIISIIYSIFMPIYSNMNFNL